MITSPQDFEESTAFELYVLETVSPAIERKSGSYLDLRGGGTIGAAIGVSVSESLSADAVNQLKDTLAPLLFGAAWKVLDLLLELALNRGGLTPAGRYWTIEKKQQHALNGDGNYGMLGCSGIVWGAILRVYAATVEHRHCLVHRTAKVNATSGELEGVNRANQPLKRLTREEQVALAKVSGLVARAVVAGGIDRRSENHLRYYLDLVRAHSEAAAFGIPGASAPMDILLTLARDDARFILDMSGVLDRARATCPSVAHFDLLIDVPDGSGRHLFARAEECPPGKSSIDLNTLPSWLKFI